MLSLTLNLLSTIRNTITMKSISLRNQYPQQRARSRPRVGAVLFVAMLACCFCLCCLLPLAAKGVSIQPINYLLDDSAILEPGQSDADTMSHFLREPADKDSIISTNEHNQQSSGASNLDNGEATLSHFSAEMADLIRSEHQQMQQQAAKDDPQGEQPSLSSSVAHVLMKVAEAAASADSNSQDDQLQRASEQIILNDNSGQNSALASSAALKSELKMGPLWYNPKETIPVLKISSMATPSKYKKVYFRSEKKLVDGAFHSPSANEKDETKSFKRAFISSIQRRSSRASTSSSVAPPGILQDGVMEFLRKFREVYVQTRPTSASASPSSSIWSSAPSSILAPSVSRPVSLLSTLGALSSAASKVNSGSSLSQASGSSTGSSAASQLSAAASNAIASVVAAPSSSSNTALSTITGSSATSNKSPLNAQTYVNFWSKTFPDWVRKMLKQMRRRSLQNHSKRQQQQLHQSHSTLGQAAQAAANVASAIQSSSSSSSSTSG